MKCLYCKKVIPKDCDFCIYCGQPISIDAISKRNIKKILQKAKDINTDLLEVSAHECSCKYCATFQGKIFSITGKDNRYPKLPEQVLQTGSFHKGCRHTFFPYYHGSKLVYSQKELEKINNTAI